MNKIDSIVKHDTTIILKPVISPVSKSAVPKVKQENKNGPNEYFDNKAPNNGIQGGTGNSQTIIGSIQTHPDEIIIKAIEQKFPNKNEPFQIQYPVSSHISVVYASELRKMLLDEGYKIVNMMVDLSGQYHPKQVTPFTDIVGVYVQAE